MRGDNVLAGSLDGLLHLHGTLAAVGDFGYPLSRHLEGLIEVMGRWRWMAMDGNGLLRGVGIGELDQTLNVTLLLSKLAGSRLRRLSVGIWSIE